MSLKSPSSRFRRFSKVVTFRLCLGLFRLSPLVKCGSTATVTSGKSSPDNSLLEKDNHVCVHAQNIILYPPSNFYPQREVFFTVYSKMCSTHLVCLSVRLSFAGDGCASPVFVFLWTTGDLTGSVSHQVSRLKGQKTAAPSYLIQEEPRAYLSPGSFWGCAAACLRC